MVSMAVLIRTFSSGIHTHPVSWNCAYCLRIELSDGGCFPNLVRNFRWTIVARQSFWITLYFVENSQVLWEFRLPLWCIWGFLSSGTLWKHILHLVTDVSGDSISLIFTCQAVLRNTPEERKPYKYFFPHIRTVRLDIIRVLFVHQLMHQWVVLKTILKFALEFKFKQLRHVSVLFILTTVSLATGESNGKLPPRTCPGCSVPHSYR